MKSNDENKRIRLGCSSGILKKTISDKGLLVEFIAIGG